MKITLITPYAGRSRTGNRNTAYRYAGFLRQLGHQVSVQVNWDGLPADMMLALHARRSHDSIRRFADAYPQRPLILVLTGTDLYRDIRQDSSAQLSMNLATRMIVLQEMGLNELSQEQRDRTRVIYQSVTPPKPCAKLKKYFQVCVIGHLRAEKDPFRCALALSHLPSPGIRVIQLGGALEPAMAEQARTLMHQDSRYSWTGELPHWRAMHKLAQSHLMVISSRMEGGANVICEALAAEVPVIASDIAGNIGMLGKDYDGYFPLENESVLAERIGQAMNNEFYYRKLLAQCQARSHLFSPEREKNDLASLLDEL
ncbi:MAG: selenoneine biosynthesis selenosugar synthase SenB [Sulfurimicrobium sp.]|nr:selenoneine biosynthesis selenosugar synthase SenB [Sulfurimicrobium sp.]MDO9188544.1 selenoneine biosynthesis selenosugar synthase SenB [Sulfurimicrobium sp.]MDP2200104.1 selenoneine biosynthesis selenosugar synthase SenB [Sulfurimicrobium sp.]MDP3687454.1 selenoneine biosynthesis selenosugar synthase SenB [Sulfurimicrobium sp.]